METITLTFDEDLLARAREDADKQGLTLNEFVDRSIGKSLAYRPGDKLRALAEEARRERWRMEGGPLSREEANTRA